MNIGHPAKLEEIFSLRLRLREQLQYFRDGERIVAERLVETLRYALRPWQYEMILRFDGRRTFEDAAREVHAFAPGSFTGAGLLNFYNWLCDEDLVVCECESVFELVTEDAGDKRDEPGERKVTSFSRRGLDNPRMLQLLKLSAVVLFSLSVLRIAYVAAPVFEPPVNRLYAEAGRILKTTDAVPAESIAKSERSASPPSVEKVELAALAVEEKSPLVREESAVVVKRETISETVPEFPSEAGEERIETLRQHLEECRIRRDEFYLQNDEDGYRREVHRMTNLAKEIGDIENGL